MSEIPRVSLGLVAMFLASAGLNLLPGPEFVAEPDRFFYGSPALAAWVALTAFVSGAVGGWIGGRWFPLVALGLLLALNGVVFWSLQAIAAPVESVTIWEIASRNSWPFGASLIGTFTGGHFGVWLRSGDAAIRGVTS